jgi:hypothetical protein
LFYDPFTWVLKAALKAAYQQVVSFPLIESGFLVKSLCLNIQGEDFRP